VKASRNDLNVLWYHDPPLRRERTPEERGIV
jgi:hypothetical protein